MLPYHLEEQDSAIMNAVKNRKLVQGSSRVYTIKYFESHGLGWWLINNVTLLCDNDCFEPIVDLKVNDQIFYLINHGHILNSNGGIPVAAVRDGKGKILYESPGYRMAIDQLNTR